MMKVFGHPASTCTRKVLMTLAETGVPYDFELVDIATGANKSAENTKRQPFGRVPAVDDDGFALFESRAICRYVNEVASGKLVPSDTKARAKMEQWISIETSEFTPHAMKFIYEYVFKRPQAAGVLDAAGKGLDTCLALMDTQLAETKFLAGNDFSLADICCMPYFEYAMMSPAKELFAKYPHVTSWWKAVSERSSWQKASGKAS